MANLRNIYDSRRIWKVVFIVISLVLVALFLYISNNLVKDLAEQERERMEIWAEATQELATMGSGSEVDEEGNPIPSTATDVDFLFSIIEGNHNIPVLPEVFFRAGAVRRGLPHGDCQDFLCCHLLIPLPVLCLPRHYTTAACIL